MKFRLKKKLLILASFQLGILAISFFTSHKITLVRYINISFYITAALLITSLFIYTIHTGFYDAISKSLNFSFSRGQWKRKFNEIPSLSELVTISPKPALFYGSFTGLFMLIALVCYYILRT
ncbi:MAG: hypothetical protein ACXVNF_10270 [Neobacillus sp.]